MNYLFFDTETTGLLPKDCDVKNNIDNFPRLVELAFVLLDSNLNKIYSADYIIKPEGFEIPIVCSNIHQITTEIANEKGIEIKKVLEDFQSNYDKSDCVVCHNFYFDRKIVESELFRQNIIIEMKKKLHICTMMKTIKFVGALFKNGRPNKYPTLTELYFKLFNKDFENKHNALSDVNATIECFIELINNNHFVIDDIIKNFELKKEKFKNENTNICFKQ
jgi:DNA polymerase III epsilon subunit-like protein